MPTQRSIDRVLGFGRIVLAALKGDMKAILANVAEFEDDNDQPAGGANEQPMFGVAGHYCRPMPPDQRGACEAVFAREADGATPIATRDLRATRLVAPTEGAVGLAHYAGGFVELSWDADKRGTLLVLRASRCDAQLDAVEKAHAIVLDPASATPSIQVIHHEGNAIVLDKDGHVTITDKTAKNMIDVGPDGITISSDSGGVKIVGGQIVGSPAGAKKVVLLDELAEALSQIEAVVTALATWATSVNASAATGSPYAGIMGATITPKVAAVSATGASNTLKASPT